MSIEHFSKTMIRCSTAGCRRTYLHFSTHEGASFVWERHLPSDWRKVSNGRCSDTHFCPECPEQRKIDWGKFHSMVHRDDAHRVFLSVETYDHIQSISKSVGEQPDWEDMDYGEHHLHGIKVYHDDSVPLYEILILDPHVPTGSRTFTVPE